CRHPAAHANENPRQEPKQRSRAASTSTRTQGWKYETKSVRRMYAADAPMGAWERKRVRYPGSGFQRDFPSASLAASAVAHPGVMQAQTANPRPPLDRSAEAPQVASAAPAADERACNGRASCVPRPPYPPRAMARPRACSPSAGKVTRASRNDVAVDADAQSVVVLILDVIDRSRLG